ncbi:deoxyribonuclease V [Thermogemmatispora carboxidivorans]|uniref:deoxyribonuclease V n=1 Tax=Thermogemmatispora carboxidivorans TaxID=1382306 RepID=UPI0009DCB355|nr:deoxyribonuclease V [Thermogemmatispora carboxidivorans]
MRAVHPLHEWNLQPEQAIALQKELASRVIREDRLPSQIQHIAGVDLAINENNGLARAAAVLLSYPSLELEEQHVYEEPVRMEYIPGLLSFRELPCVLGALNLLRQEPDLIMVDGQGIAHPRRLGIASHLGLWLDLPTIGCAKSVLRGHYNEQELGATAGSWVPLLDHGEIIGAAVRTREHVKPMIISIGHRISLETSIRYALSCCRGYRLPEPTRLADRLSKNNAYREPASRPKEGQDTANGAVQDSLWQ